MIRPKFESTLKTNLLNAWETVAKKYLEGSEITDETYYKAIRVASSLSPRYQKLCDRLASIMAFSRHLTAEQKDDLLRSNVIDYIERTFGRECLGHRQGNQKYWKGVGNASIS